MTNDLRAAMSVALKEIVIPILRNRRFTGSFPHFRRVNIATVDLLTFQFDKWGGGFIVEIASGSIDGWITHWGKHIPANKLTAHDLHPDSRKRIQPRDVSGSTAACPDNMKDFSVPQAAMLLRQAGFGQKRTLSAKIL
jgi:hypothetical protein